MLERLYIIQHSRNDHEIDLKLVRHPASAHQTGGQPAMNNQRLTDISCYFQEIVRDMVPSSGSKVVRYAEARERCVAKGLKPGAFDR